MKIHREISGEVHHTKEEEYSACSLNSSKYYLVPKHGFEWVDRKNMPLSKH